VHVSKEEEYFLRIGLDSQTPYILIFKAQNIKDPRTFFFEEINDEKINSIKIIPYDKLIYIETEKHTLECIFYGKEKNIRLKDKKEKIIGSFKKNKTSQNIPSDYSPAPLSTTRDLLNLDKTKIKQTISAFLTKNLGGYNKRLSEEVCFRSTINPTTQVADLKEDKWRILVDNIIAIESEIKEDDYFLYEIPDQSVVLSLVKLNQMPDTYKITVYPDANSAWKQYIYLSQQSGGFDKILQRCREKIKKRIAYLERTLKKITDFKDLEEKKAQSEIKGFLLQTFANDIKKGSDQVKLKNIYSEEEEYITITLNPRLSTHDNAAKYFNKYKDIDTKKESLKFKEETYQNELKYWKKIYHDSEKIDNLKKAEQLEQLLVQKKLIQKRKENNKPDSGSDISSFNRVLLNGKWEIVIGKNAENNDLLTFQFANKYDLWLHAQGVSGSHVVIRKHNKNTNPPMEIIKQAASIAAFFSGAKNSSSVPVNYTEVRYVRKPRKAPSGTVVISNSKTIFVEPKKYI
jgi:predicted ribosome quality control (RQC) complex YloA/Tae2 family protein